MSSGSLQRLRDWRAETAIVLGSGLSAIVESASSEQRIAYSEFPELPPPRVPGHVGQFVLASCGNSRVIFALGRIHLYEGHSATAVTAGVRLLADCGVRRLILTNAAGNLRPEVEPGSWMMLGDHLNLTGTTPLIGDPQFLDLTDAYSASWRAEFRQAAAALGLQLNEGVYAGLIGPQYETPAEIRMLRTLGADAVGMSTVLETIQARALGLQVAGFSCLTNWAAGMNGQDLSHHEVLATGRASAAAFARLVAAAL